jgi:hypothetical protein
MTTLKQMIKEKGDGAKFEVDENCESHRIALWRIWSASQEDVKYLNFIMINPSKANQEKNDSTVWKCIQIAKDNSCDGVIVTNLFTLVETKVRRLFDHKRTNLEECDSIIREAAELSQYIVCAWGKYGKVGKENSWRVRKRGKEVIAILKDMRRTPKCLGENPTDNSPKHPLSFLYVKNETPIPLCGVSIKVANPFP